MRAARYDEAEKLYVEAIAMKHRLLGENHPEIALTLENLGPRAAEQGELAGAEARYREALAMQRPHARRCTPGCRQHAQQHRLRAVRSRRQTGRG